MTLITAQDVENRGIKMMAVPSSALDLRSAGTISQIEKGATLVKTAEYKLAILTNKMR